MNKPAPYVIVALNHEDARQYAHKIGLRRDEYVTLTPHTGDRPTEGLHAQGLYVTHTAMELPPATLEHLTALAARTLPSNRTHTTTQKEA